MNESYEKQEYNEILYLKLFLLLKKLIKEQAYMMHSNPSFVKLFNLFNMCLKSSYVPLTIIKDFTHKICLLAITTN